MDILPKILPDHFCITLTKHILLKRSPLLILIQLLLLEVLDHYLAVQVLMAGIKSAGSGLLTVLSSIAPALLGLLGVGIVFQAGKTVWDNILTNNGSKKRYPTSSKTYQEVPFIIANVIFAKYFYDRNRFPSVPASVASP